MVYKYGLPQAFAIMAIICAMVQADTLANVLASITIALAILTEVESRKR